MKRILTAVFALGVLALGSKAEVSLDRCITSAEDNYPLVRKYDLLNATREIDLSEINRGWLPRLGAYAQATAQNVVPSFPSTLSKVMEQMGGEIRGLGKLQYKAGLDIQQIVWDGGASKVRREITRRQTDVSQAALQVDLYDLRRRVESLYFGILLVEDQIAQTESALAVYEANLQRLQAMVANGAAMQCDADMVEAQLLGLKQQLIRARSAAKGYRDVLSIFTGMDLSGESLQMPSAQIPDNLTSDRPELALFASRMDLNASRKQLATIGVMPKVGLFAQTYYGYPGIDYFKAMTSRNPTFNILAGVKVSWNIDSYYTRKPDERKLDIANSEIEADRETFLFNTRMQAASQLEEVGGLEALMRDDSRIVELRKSVRNAAESQLRNGVIDATGLITKINDETQALLAASFHSIQRLQAIYNLRNTLNR